MNPSNYRRITEIIGQITDPAQLQQMRHNPQYAGFTNIIEARIGEITRMRGAAQGAQQPQPSVTDQAMQGGEQDQQLMAKGGIVAFKHGGKVRNFASGGPTSSQEAADAAAQRNRAGITDAWDSLKYTMNRPAVPMLRETLGIGETARPQAPTTSTAPINPQAQPDSGQQKQIALPPIAFKDPDSSVGGLGSLSARSSSGGRGDGERRVKTAAEYATEQNAILGPNTAATEERANIQDQKAGAFDNFLMRAGLGMANAATQHPQGGILGAGAAGATEGLAGYTTEAAARNAQLANLARTERAEKVARMQGILAERGQDVRADMADRRQAQAIAMQGQTFKAAANLERNTQALAMQRLNADRANGKLVTMADFPAYHQQAWVEYNPALGSAGIRGDVAARSAQIASLTKQLATAPDEVSRSIITNKLNALTADDSAGTGPLRSR